ncbi:phage tail family protein [Lysinibacillus fusiformis]|uniref:phage tail family protein n=1 Tax=Lysinibacillus fusiformis TaxID=28031 RepID=UPI0034E19EC7
MTVEKVVFTNMRGQTVELTNRLPFLLESVEGRGEVDADVQMQTAPYQDGASHVDTLLSTRSLTLNVNLIADNRDDLNLLRHQISSAFNPKTGKGLLVYSNGQTEREIEVVVDGSPAFPVGDAKGNWFQRTAINLIAPDPYWRDVFIENYKLEDFVSNFRFSFHFPVRFATRGDSKMLINKGDVPTPIKVEFRGPVINPKITNLSTGEFIKVNREIPKGYKLILDTSFGNKRVEIIGPDGIVQNAFHYIDLASTFFNLDVGENQFAFITDSGSPEVYVEYQHRYLSV